MLTVCRINIMYIKKKGIRTNEDNKHTLKFQISIYRLYHVNTLCFSDHICCFV